MFDVIEKLLNLQDRDRAIAQLEDELRRIPPERTQLQQKLELVQGALESAKHRVKQLETERKKLELEVEQKQGLIEKYSLQQYQTKKNEEYRALDHEITLCRQAISELEDAELNIMEQTDAAQKQVTTATRESKETKAIVDSRLADLDAREKQLRGELKQLQTGREALAAAVEPGALVRYERLFRSKGGNVVVGIHRGVCGGCHMQLSRQTVVHCQAKQEIVTCINCSRILYYTRDMDVALVE